MDIKLLKAKMALEGYSMRMLAKDLGIGKATLYRKIRGESVFNSIEILRISQALSLNLKDINEIFFDSMVS